MDACIAAAIGPQRRVAIVMRYTGLRVGQVMRLRWDDVDLEASTLRIRPELGKSRAESVGRTVPISAHLVREMAGWGLREGWLIPSFRQPGPRERTFRARDLGRAWERAGVRAEVWQGRPDHAFRKGFRSELRRAGGDSEAVEYLLGHRLGRGEEGTYTDPDALPLRATVDLIPDLSAPVLGSGAVDIRWTRAVQAARSDDEKQRLKLVAGMRGGAEGGTRSPSTESAGRSSKLAVGGRSEGWTPEGSQGPAEVPVDTGRGQGVDMDEPC
jgi:hypothetical protein